MASKAQIAANRANAKKSTGPGEAGKAKSRLNALRDGLTGQITTLSDEDRPIFEKLKAEHIADLAPKTVTELKLAHAIAWDTWRLDHLRATEMNIYALGAEAHSSPLCADSADTEDPADPDDPQIQTARADADTFRTEAKRFELMSLYETRMNCGIHRNLATLRDLQAERRRSYERDRDQEILLARFHEIKEVPHQTAAAPSSGGFLFSNDEIAAAAARQRTLEAASYTLQTFAPWIKYGATGTGSPDLFADMPVRKPPASIGPKIHGISPESIAIRKLYHPES